MIRILVVSDMFLRDINYYWYIFIKSLKEVTPPKKMYQKVWHINTEGFIRL